MSNVAFKKGLKSNLNTTTVPLVDGQLIFTTDEQALYLDHDYGTTAVNGKTGLQRIRIGNTVHVSQTWQQFQADTAGSTQDKDAIYYIVAENILCAWDGASNKWTQINAQKLWSDYFDTFTTATQTGTGKVIVRQSLQKDNQSLLSTALTVKDSSSTKVAAIASGNSDAPGITIHSEVDTASFAPTANANGITLGIKTSGNINGTTVNDSRLGGQITITPATDQQGNMASGTRINTVGSVTENSANYTIESAQTEYIQYNKTTGIVQSKWVSAASQTAAPAAADVLMNGAPIKPSIKYGDNLDQDAVLNWSHAVDDNTDIRTVNLEFDLAVYSKSEIDSKLKAVNAMVFMGGIGDRADGDPPITLPTTGVHVGDTYAVTTGFSITENNNTENYLPGDLIIATGTEGNDGTITSNLHWEHVQSGMDINATYQYAANIGQRKIMLQLNSVTTGTLAFDPNFTISQTGSGTDRVVTVSHATPQDDGQNNKAADTTAWSSYANPTKTVDLTTSNPASQSEVTYDSTNGQMVLTQQVVTGVKVNSTGHIVGFETKTLKITDTRSGITSIVPNEYIAAGNHKAAFTTQVNLATGDDISYRHYIESESLHLSNTNTTEDASIRVELVWGSF